MVTVSGSEGTFCPRYLPVLQVICLPNDRLRTREEEHEQIPSKKTSVHITLQRSITHTSQGTPPTVTVMSSLVAVSRSSPSMVITVPPAAGPFAGWTSRGLGSWGEKMMNELLLPKSGFVFNHRKAQQTDRRRGYNTQIIFYN